MKLKVFACVAAVLSLALSCKKETPEEQGAEFKFKAELVQFSPVGTAVSPTVLFSANDELGIIPVAAKANPELKSKDAVKFAAKGAGANVEIASSSVSFIPDETISKHCFAGVFPYVSASDETKLQVAVPASQTVTKLESVSSGAVPFYSYYEISSPSKGATIQMRFNPAVAIVGVPVQANTTSVKLTVSAEASPIAGVAVVNAITGDITPAAGAVREIELAVSGDVAGGWLYFSIIPGDHRTKDLQATVTTKTGTQNLVLGGAKFQAGKVYQLEDKTPETPSIYKIAIDSVKFDESFMYEARDEKGEVVAVICKEYLDTVSNQQAITVYGVKQGKTSRVIDSENPVCLVARVLKSAPEGDYANYTDVDSTALVHGGVFSFAASGSRYTEEGSQAALPVVYAKYNKTAGTTEILKSCADSTSDARLFARTIIFSDRADTIKFRVVKMGRQIWTADDINTLKFNDGTDIKKVTASELYPLDTAACVNTASSSFRIVYNVAAVKSDKYLPQGMSWKIPTAGDFKTLISRIPKSGMITQFAGATNITCLSVVNKARVTNESWSKTKTMDPCFWSQTASTEGGKEQTHTQALVVRQDALGAPSVTISQNNHFGFYVRLVRGLY